MKHTPLKQIAHIIGQEASNETPIQGVAVDSRLVHPGNLFFALPGEKTDGHKFLDQAASRGASAAVVHTSYQGEDFGLPLIRSSNVLESLQLLAKATLSGTRARIVAVTGSLGKTTTKGFLLSLLKQKFKVAASPGNSNSQIGLPLTILNHLSLDEEVIVLEMGMTRAGQISKLVEIAPPEIAVVTVVSSVHIGFFDSLEGIARAKGEIFTHPATKLGIYHLESDLNQLLSTSGACPKVSFSMTSAEANHYLKNDEDGLHIRPHGTFPQLKVPGAHNRHNFLAAVTVAKYLGMSNQEIVTAQETLELPEQRLQFIEKSGVLFINDAYNASALSIEAALHSLPEPPEGRRKIAVLGGIVDQGKFSEATHRSVGECALEHVDCMFCFGDDCLPIYECWQAVKRPVVWTKNRVEVALALRKALRPGDVVLLKGSRSKEVWKVLDEL